MKIHEWTRVDGTLARVVLRCDDDGLHLEVDEEEEKGPESLSLPPQALEAVMSRFGLPLEPGEHLSPVAELDLGDGRRLRHARHLARHDVIAKDYLVYEAPLREPSCALATTVAGALVHLGRAAART